MHVVEGIGETLCRVYAKPGIQRQQMALTENTYERLVPRNWVLVQRGETECVTAPRRTQCVTVLRRTGVQIRVCWAHPSSDSEAWEDSE